MSVPRELLDAYAGSTVYLGENGEYSADALIPAAFAALRAVLDLHPRFPDYESRHTRCRHCGVLWPCATVQAITTALEGT